MNCTVPDQWERCLQQLQVFGRLAAFKEDNIQAKQLQMQKDFEPHSCSITHLWAGSSWPRVPFLRDSQFLISSFYQDSSLSRPFLNATCSYTGMQMSHHTLGSVLESQKHKVRRCLSTAPSTKPQSNMTYVGVCILTYVHIGIQVRVCICIPHYIIQIINKSTKSI